MSLLASEDLARLVQGSLQVARAIPAGQNEEDAIVTIRTKTASLKERAELDREHVVEPLLARAARRIGMAPHAHRNIPMSSVAVGRLGKPVQSAGASAVDHFERNFQITRSTLPIH